MQSQLVLKDGRVIPLSDATCELILRIVDSAQGNTTEAPAPDLETLRTEFADLYGSQAPSTEDLLEERRRELERERRKIDRLA